MVLKWEQDNVLHHLLDFFSTSTTTLSISVMVDKIDGLPLAGQYAEMLLASRGDVRRLGDDPRKGITLRFLRTLITLVQEQDPLARDCGKQQRNWNGFS